MASLSKLEHFVEAQNPVHAQVVEELKAGAKTSHWMWFVFPQLLALGRSAMAAKFGIESLEQARTYWQHPVLGPRLKECVQYVLATNRKSALQIFGPPDDMKLRSSMTLFACAVPEEPMFRQVLTKYFDGRDDPRTLALLPKA